MRSIKILTFVVVLLLLPFVCDSSAKVTIKCEVLDSGRAAENLKGDWQNLHYVVFHHAHSEDRAKLSEYLKSCSGSEVQFTFRGKSYKALLFRLPHCFGRGLLLYRKDIELEKKDIVEIE